MATFLVTATSQSQFALFLDGLVLSDSIYGTVATNNAGAPGQVIFSASAGQVLTLNNHSSTGVSGSVTLPGLSAGSQLAVNASIALMRLM
jgi:hypothetical protein